MRKVLDRSHIHTADDGKRYVCGQCDRDHQPARDPAQDVFLAVCPEHGLSWHYLIREAELCPLDFQEKEREA